MSDPVTEGVEVFKEISGRASNTSYVIGMAMLGMLLFGMLAASLVGYAMWKYAAQAQEAQTEVVKASVEAVRSNAETNRRMQASVESIEKKQVLQADSMEKISRSLDSTLTDHQKIMDKLSRPGS